MNYAKHTTEELETLVQEAHMAFWAESDTDRAEDLARMERMGLAILRVRAEQERYKK